jgi:hypothetical protein
VTEQRVLHRGLAARHGLLLRLIQAATATVSHTLHFFTKLGLFHFIISPEAAELEHLQFCRELVVEDKTLPLRRELTEALRREAELREEVGHVIDVSDESNDAIVIDDAAKEVKEEKC